MATKAERVLAEVGLPAEPGLVRRAGEYLDRTRRGRRRGLIAGFAMGVTASILAPFQESDLSLKIPMLLAGYVLAILVTELRVPVPARHGRRMADLAVRSSAGLLPRWARVAIWASALPVVAAAIVMPAAAALAHGVRGSGLTQAAGLACFGSPVPWPASPILAAGACVAVTGLLIAEYGLATLARRPRPADDEKQARLDDALRGLSARALAGGATALSLALAAVTCDSVSELASANVCTSRGATPVPQYPWLHAHLHPWAGLLGLAFLIAAVATVAICRRRQDPRLVARQERVRAAA